MKKRKNIIIVLLILIIGCGLLGCNNSNKKDKLSIVTTIYPQYDWICEILGVEKDNIDVTMLLSNGIDLHNYQPTSLDIINIINCDMFVYVGGESDEWVNDVLKQSKNENMIVINLFDVLKDDLIEMNHDHNHEYDEHIWLSIKNAIKVCNYLYEKICLLDENNKSKYKQNLDNYLVLLNELDVKYQNTINNSQVKTIVFADRFPFMYLARDYNLNYFAAFTGCNAEAEVSFDTIISLANTIDELNLKKVLIIDGSDGSIANTVISNTKTKDQTILKINSLQSMSNKEIDNGNNYLSVMESNLDVINKALN